ncbi:MAG: ABC-type sugar transport system permease subunit [Ilumatobacter sp.]
MTTLDDTNQLLGDDSIVTPNPIIDPDAPSPFRRAISRIAFGLFVLALVYGVIFSGKVRSTVILAVAAVGITGGVWIGANLLFNQATKRWALFNAARFGIVGFAFAAVISGNRLTNKGGDGGFFADLANWIWLPLVIAAVLAAAGYLLSKTEDPTSRIAIGAAGFGIAGAVIGALLESSVRPDLDIVATIGGTVIVGAVGASVSMLRKQPPVGGAIIGGAIGWALGAFGMPDLGSGSAGWAIIAAAVPAAMIGTRIGMAPPADSIERTAVDRRSRPVIFIGPAVLFLTGTLVIPALRTLYLSFLGRDSEEFVGIDNYTETFTDKTSLDLSNWSDALFNWPMRIGLMLTVIFFVIGSKMRQRTGKWVELGSPSFFPMIGAGLFLSFAIFTTSRGTIVNNIWWVIVVTLVSTALGLAVAVLADGALLEKVAKSLIFMPMAISLVGASVIWRFMYVARDSSKEQTGVLNAIWVGLGRLSTGRGIAATLLVAIAGMLALAVIATALKKRKYLLALVAVVLAPVALYAVAWIWAQFSGDVQRLVIGLSITAVFGGLLAALVQPVQRREYGQMAVPGLAALLLGWFLIRYWGIIGGGVGGQETNGNGELISSPINFIQESPYNNIFLMVVLIWIQTGFAMVILSAAIQAVPEEILEAARVDGATTSQVFWRVTLPQIAPTIGVVVTTIIVLVMKVFDIVKVMTNSNFGTQVLANDMFNQAFNARNTGRGAALAMLIFISVMPIMVANIRRMQKEG